MGWKSELKLPEKSAIVLLTTAIINETGYDADVGMGKKNMKSRRKILYMMNRP